MGAGTGRASQAGVRSSVLILRVTKDVSGEGRPPAGRISEAGLGEERQARIVPSIRGGRSLWSGAGRAERGSGTFWSQHRQDFWMDWM